MIGDIRHGAIPSGPRPRETIRPDSTNVTWIMGGECLIYALSRKAGCEWFREMIAIGRIPATAVASADRPLPQPAFNQGIAFRILRDSINMLSVVNVGVNPNLNSYVQK